jgi:adenylate kinase family enzyme
MARRIVIYGTSGVGKTTLGAELAQRLGVPFIELDALHHGPNWAEPPAEEFRGRVRAAMAAAPDGWVIDGNYTSKLGDTVSADADTIVWLDLPLWVMFPRLWRRTMHRIVNKVELWNGNRETWRDQFASRETIFFWSVQRLYQYRREWPARFAGERRLVRLRSNAEARRWLEGQAGGPDGAGARSAG